MKRHDLVVVLMLLSLALIVGACGKDGGVCFSNSGPVIMQDRTVTPFDSIALYDNVDLVITQDTTIGVRVEAGQNIISGITTTVTDNTLTIHNNNSCNWLRSYDKPIRVHVSVVTLQKLHYESAGNVSSTNTIHAGHFYLDLWGGCGVVDMDLYAFEGTFIQHLGTADMVLHGICKISSVYAGDFGRLNLGALESDYCFVINNSSNDCYVKATKLLDATIGSLGNIYYTGSPDSLFTQVTGSGAVLPF